ncbi:MAG: GNAT family N-acetyltransferase [Elusimicrobiota bacterium]
MGMLRLARAEDLPALTAIYNDAVARTTGTFDTVPKTWSQMDEWFSSHDASHPVLVAEADGAVAAWAALSPSSDRCAYARTSEVSVYVSEPARGRGLGGKLLDELLRLGRAAGTAQVLARITAGNEASLRLHARRGFVEVGHLRRVGEKFGKILDVLILQKDLEEAS